MPTARANPDSNSWSDPAESASAITPSDATVLSPITRSLYVGSDGDVTVIMARDSAEVTFVGVAGGTILPVRVKQVMATDTTATDIVGLY